MNKYIRIIFLVLFFYLQISYSQTANVAFFVIDKNPRPDKEVFITGDNEQLGNWNPSLIKLKKLSDSLWTINFNFKVGSVIEFKFTRGSWDEEALDKNMKVPSNSVLKVNRDTLVYIEIFAWKNSETKKKSTKTGNIIEHKGFKFDGLRERDISVWLPPSYNKDLSKRYPVLYMHDGQNIFDEANVAFGVEWKVDETLDSLIKNDEIKEIIVVGINNTKDRRLEYSNTELGFKYSRLIIDSIKPFIDKNYRTLSDCENTAVAGSSMGGMISFILGWEYPEVFCNIGCFSPAIKVQLNDTLWLDYLSIAKKTPVKKVKKIYIDNGIKFDERLQPGVDETLSFLYEIGYKDGKDLLYIKDKINDHNEIAWSIRFPEFIKFIFGKN